MYTEALIGLSGLLTKRQDDMKLGGRFVGRGGQSDQGAKDEYGQDTLAMSVKFSKTTFKMKLCYVMYVHIYVCVSLCEGHKIRNNVMRKKEDVLRGGRVIHMI